MHFEAIDAGQLIETILGLFWQTTKEYELWGAIVDERQREALKVAAENIPGVKEVKDHLAFVEPTSGIIIEPRNEVATR